MQAIDKFLNSITMYRLTLYYLFALVGIAIIAGFLGLLPFSGFDVLISSAIAIIAGYLSNIIFAKLFGATTNIESVFITSLILVLIVPLKFPLDVPFIVGVNVFAMASKYFPTIDKRHIFNPAAVAIAAFALLFPDHVAAWWVGTQIMVLPVLAGGFLIMHKIRREKMIGIFLLVYVIIILETSFIRTWNIISVFTTLEIAITKSAVFFFAFVMLTEPLTSPVTTRLQIWYGALVAVLYTTPQLRLFGIVLTPEWALLYGNLFAYVVNPKYRLNLKLEKIEMVTHDCYTFTFTHVDKFKFTPGQYMEWTLSHKKADSRGNRRYFSIASSPTEENIMLLVKFYNPPSSYKKNMLEMKVGSKIIATSLAGDFVLPKNYSTPLTLIGGGVGIAPFRSMVKYIIDKKMQVDIVLIFTNKTPEDIIFEPLFKEAEQFGVRTHYMLTEKDTVPADWKGNVGYLTTDMIKNDIPDYQTRKFYVSGPEYMVLAVEKTLHDARVPRKNIKTDFFPGYSYPTQI